MRLTVGTKLLVLEDGPWCSHTKKDDIVEVDSETNDHGSFGVKLVQYKHEAISLYWQFNNEGFGKKFKIYEEIVPFSDPIYKDDPRYTGDKENRDDEFGLEEDFKEDSKLKTGTRYNSGKIRWRNFPMFLIEPLAKVAEFGEQKYTTYNFLKGMKTNDSLDSLKRHLTSFESPYESDDDLESKQSHLAHIAWNALVALHMLRTRPELDDRYKGE